MHRTVLFSFDSAEEALRFVEIVKQKAVSNADIVVKGSKVKVVVHGTKDEIARSIAKLKELAGCIRQMGRVVGGLRVYALPVILLDVKPRVGLPFEAIADVLRLRGFTAKLQGAYILTSAGEKAVFDAVLRFSRLYEEAVRDLEGSTLVKRLVAVYGAANKLGLDEAVEQLADMGLIAYDEDSGRWRLAKNYAECIRTLASGEDFKSSRE